MPNLSHRHTQAFSFHQIEEACEAQTDPHPVQKEAHRLHPPLTRRSMPPAKVSVAFSHVSIPPVGVLHTFYQEAHLLL